MKAIEYAFDNGPVFVAYITAGHHDLNITKQAAIALAKGGVDILEIGVPFSDPIADGPVIQQAMNTALNQDVNLRSVLEMIHDIKQHVNIPIVLFTYYNPLLNRGLDKFFSEAQEAKLDSLLIVDLPTEESEQVMKQCYQITIAPVSVISPSTPIERIQYLDKHDNAFLYYVCRNGITGVRNALPCNYTEKMNTIKQHTQSPVVTGFGISTREHARMALSAANGFVVGSLFVKAIEEGINANDLTQLAINIDPRGEMI